MNSTEFEAIVWSMLRLENEIGEIERKLYFNDLDGNMETYLKTTLDKNKQHFEAFKGMIEGVKK
jgi:hypothetical protein